MENNEQAKPARSPSHRVLFDHEVSILQLFGARRYPVQPCASVGHQKRRDFVRGLSLRGYVATTFAELRSVFGEPSRYLEVPANWDITFDDGTNAAVYVYKRRIPTRLFWWHVGGRSRAAVERVAQALRTEYIIRRPDEPDDGDEDEIPF